MDRSVTRRSFLRRAGVLATASIVVSACARLPSPSNSTGSVAQEAKVDKVTFLTPPWGVPPDAAAFTDFQTKAGFQVEVQSVPSEQLTSKVQTASSAGTAPADVIFFGLTAVPDMVVPGYLAPLDEYMGKLDTKDFNHMDQWIYKGKQYAVDSYVQLVMLDYNQKRLQAAGFTNPPTTFAELDQMAKTIKQKGVDEYPISMGGFWLSWVLISLALGDPMFDDNLNATFGAAGSKAQDGMATLLRWFNSDKLISPDLINHGTPHDVFQAGIGVFHQSWQGALAVMNNPKNSKQAPDVRYMLLPDTHTCFSSDAGVGISAFSKAKSAAWQFVEWYTGADNQKAIWDAYGLVPSRTSAWDQLNQAGKVEQFDVQQEQAKYNKNFPLSAPWMTQWQTFFDETLRKGIQGNQDAATIVSTVAKEWDRLKAQQK
jgi:multiple sugar transport system substrate-binding protein